MSEKTGKSRSARAKPHDWEALDRAVKADMTRGGPITWVWGEYYGHAIEKALVGRDNTELLRMLDEGQFVHPLFLPAIADVIRSQTDGARGRPKPLTHREHLSVRQTHDIVGPRRFREGHPEKTIKWLAEAFNTTPAVIRTSLNETKPKKK